MVDLGGGTYPFALLNVGRVVSGAFGDRLPESCCIFERFRAIERLRGKGSAQVPFKTMLTLVTFGDSTDAARILQVYPEDLAATFGEGGVMREATLEINGEKVAEGWVGEVPGWLEILQDSALEGNIYSTIHAENMLANNLLH